MQRKERRSERCSRTDLNWIFTVQTERVAAKDNSCDRGKVLAVGPDAISTHAGRKHGYNSRAPGSDGIHSIRAARSGPVFPGPNTGEKCKERGGKGGSVEAGENQTQVFSGSPTPLEIPQPGGIPTFPPLPATVRVLNQRRGRLVPPKTETGQITC